MRNALADAGVGAEDVDYINAHGTSTPENDKMEHLGVSAVFGERIRGIPISSNKSMIGHTLDRCRRGGSGVLAAHARAPAHSADDQSHMFPIPRSRSTSCPTWRATRGSTRVISNSFGFGGQNVCLVLTREPA